jgi:hypothetical protein
MFLIYVYMYVFLQSNVCNALHCIPPLGNKYVTDMIHNFNSEFFNSQVVYYNFF